MGELSGFPVLNEFFRDGLKVGLSTVIWCNPLVDCSVLAYQICYRWLKNGGLVAYFVNNKRVDIVIEDFGRYGWDVQSYHENKNLILIDSYSSAMGIKSSEPYFVSDQSNLEEISSLILRVVKEIKKPNKLLVIDSLSTLVDYFGLKILDELALWNRMSLVYSFSPIYLFTDWDYDLTLKQRLSEICDNIIDVKALERSIITTEIYTARKIVGREVKRPPIPFKLVKPGGLKVYIPKILVTGPYNAGKTTVVHGLSVRAVSVERESTTIALDFGHLEYKGFSADLFGTIGQQRFDPVLEMLGGESVGVILVVDSTKPESFPRALEMLRKARVYGLPLVVFANKQDLAEALPIEEIRRRMRLPENIPIVGTIATKKKGIFEGLEILLKQIFGVWGENRFWIRIISLHSVWA